MQLCATLCNSEVKKCNFVQQMVFFVQQNIPKMQLSATSCAKVSKMALVVQHKINGLQQIGRISCLYPILLEYTKVDHWVFSILHIL